jgi:anti-sigma-K factor RskA
MDLHELTAAYALDALDADEADAYQEHLGQCEECREELAELSDTAASLAFATVAPVPPARLRAAILDRAVAERSNVVPLRRRRWVTRGFAVATAAAASVAVALALTVGRSNHQQPVVSMGFTRGANGNATLMVSGLDTAPKGKTYEAWVIPKGKAPRPAGLFEGGKPTTIHLHGVPQKDAVVAVTVEPAGGSPAPTTTPIASSATR